MPACPVCRDDFEDDVEVCPVDAVPLVPRDQLPAPPAPEAPLGVFHPAVAEVVRAVADGRGVEVRVVEVDDDTVELRVPAPSRDKLRADLTLGWGSVIGALDEQQRTGVARVGDALPGWHDAPAGSWVDNEGRLRVDPGADEVAVEDAARRVGPVLAAAGAVGLLLAWVSGGSDTLWFVSIAALVLGLLLPL
jgi:hypothetical protein